MVTLTPSKKKPASERIEAKVAANPHKQRRLVWGTPKRSLVEKVLVWATRHILISLEEGWASPRPKQQSLLTHPYSGVCRPFGIHSDAGEPSRGIFSVTELSTRCK